MSFGAPMMASTGQAWMHLVQPMHSSSRIRARTLGFTIPLRGFSGFGARPSSSARAYHAGGAAGRALVDVGFVAGKRPGVRPAAGVAALPALGLG